MTDYTDLKRHLQRYADGCDPETVLEAAAAIAALEAEVARLRGALQDCPPTSNPSVSAQEHLDRINAWWRLTARAALTAS